MFFLFYFFAPLLLTRGLSSHPLLPMNSVKGHGAPGMFAVGAGGPRSCGHPCDSPTTQGAAASTVCYQRGSPSACSRCVHVSPVCPHGTPSPSLPISDLPCFLRSIELKFPYVRLLYAVFASHEKQRAKTQIIRSIGRSSRWFNLSYQHVVAFRDEVWAGPAASGVDCKTPLDHLP